MIKDIGGKIMLRIIENLKSVIVAVVAVVLVSFGGTNMASAARLASASDLNVGRAVYTAIVYDSSSDSYIDVSNGNIGNFLRKVEYKHKCYFVTGDLDELDNAKKVLESKGVKYERVTTDGKIKAEAFNRACDELGLGINDDAYVLQFELKDPNAKSGSDNTMNTIGTIVGVAGAIAGLVALFK